jgi:hypothetical protein
MTATGKGTYKVHQPFQSPSGIPAFLGSQIHCAHIFVVLCSPAHTQENTCLPSLKPRATQRWLPLTCRNVLRSLPRAQRHSFLVVALGERGCGQGWRPTVRRLRKGNQARISLSTGGKFCFPLIGWLAFPSLQSLRQKGLSPTEAWKVSSTWTFTSAQATGPYHCAYCKHSTASLSIICTCYTMS